MPQTMLAILAMALASLFTLNQQRAITHNHLRAVQDEYEIISSGVALEVLEYIGSVAFDSNLPAGAMGQIDVNVLTSLPFATGKAYDAAQDVDDFHEAVVPPFLVKVHGHEIRFDVSISVRYVDEDKIESLSQTTQKEVVVTVSNDRFPTPLARLTRTYAP